MIVSWDLNLVPSTFKIMVLVATGHYNSYSEHILMAFKVVLLLW
jgi:hypothetical protein